MKKKYFIIATLIMLITISFPKIFLYLIDDNDNPEILKQLKGTIYYTKRVDGVLTLFKSDAALQNQTLIYSHKGKGRDGSGEYNDNILEFFYDKTNKIYYFIAMDNGYWSKFSLKEGDSEPTLLKRDVKVEDYMVSETNYIQKKHNNLAVFSKQGSIWLLDNGEEKIIKRFYGIYDAKFTGYSPIGFSPNGEYLVYYSNNNLTPVGTLIEEIMNNPVGNMYIMDLSTKKATKFVKFHQIQWIMN